MNKRNVGYWICTAIIAFVFLSSGVVELLRPGFLMDGMRRLGYPDYLVTILGVWKILGGFAILAPGLRRAKEWAYAGMFFDMSGALISHSTIGEWPQVGAIAILLAILVASWALRPESRKLRDYAA